MSWWDYGYQIAGMSNRTTIVDNNTWNFTHIGTVGMIFASEEEEAYQRCVDLGVDYVLVNFGGYSGFQSDDWRKFLWMIRIAHDAYPSLKEADFYLNNNFGLDESSLGEKHYKSIMFKMLYHRFGEI
jgi:dolichyl-diphosphooligosaccharide--protein glycosyltransferase